MNLKLVTVQITETDYQILLRSIKQPGFGYPAVGIHKVVVNGELQPTTKD